MSAAHPSDNIRSWAPDLDEGTLVQASRTAGLPILAGPLALMPDAHIGIGATVGSVIATERALVPSAVGVDVGCGMIAARTDLTADELPDDLAPLLDRIAATIPAGVGRNHAAVSRHGDSWFALHAMPEHLDDKQRTRAAVQFGTLGSGNHFAELSIDADDAVWFVLHSGSRGIGNELAQGHIKGAKRDFVRVVEGYELEDPNLAWLVAGTPAFDAYVADLAWLQAYAAGSRDAMMHTALDLLFDYVGRGREVDRVNAHHNYAQVETHVIDGAPREVWITRKGAIRAGAGDRGIIPGSMGTSTFIVEGLGNADSWCSCAHGAGRRLSRTQAKRELTAESLAARMEGKTWLAKDAARLVDEHPDAYKDIDTVLAQQTDLVRMTHRLTQILNYKG
jgi:tRNA-splicing ligase RtcB